MLPQGTSVIMKYSRYASQQERRTAVLLFTTMISFSLTKAEPGFPVYSWAPN